MTAQPVLEEEAGSDSTRARLLSCARLLFARFGIDGVSVRDIVAAAGARNAASIHYYFGSKEALIQELVVEGARRIDRSRNRMLDAAETEAGAGNAMALRQVADILVQSSFADSPAGPEDRRGYLRFIMVLQLTHRHLFIDALQNRWNSGYMRCMAHFRRALAHLPAVLIEQRLRLLALYLGATLASREAALEGEDTSRRRLWDASFDLANLVDTLCGLLECAPAPLTLVQLGSPRRSISATATSVGASRRKRAVPRPGQRTQTAT